MERSKWTYKHVIGSYELICEAGVDLCECIFVVKAWIWGRSKNDRVDGLFSRA